MTSWRGLEGGIAAAQARHDAVMSPISHCYFDYAQHIFPGIKPKGGYIPLVKVYACEPIPRELDADEARHILGAQANVWTERMPDMSDVERMTFPRLLALAEVVWSPKSVRDFTDFTERLPDQKQKLKAMGVQYFDVAKRNK